MNLQKKIKKIIREEINDFDWIDSKELNHTKWRENAENFGGAENLAKDLYNNDPMNFLNMFNDLNAVESEEYPDWTLFRYEKRNNLMIYDRKNNYVYINYFVIWSFLEDGFGLNYSEKQKLTQKWLSEVYNLRGVTTGKPFQLGMGLVAEVYNLK